MTLKSPLMGLNGVGPQLAIKLSHLKLQTVGDLIDYLPRRYEDYSLITAISKLSPGMVTLEATISQTTSRYVRRGMHITEAIASDSTGSTRLIWFNQPYRSASLRANKKYFIAGRYELSHQHFSIQNPTIELTSDFPINTARIVPKYPEVKGLTSRLIRSLLFQLLPFIKKLPETLPSWIVSSQNLLSYSQAQQAIHFPDSRANLDAARHRIGFEEIFRLSLASLINKQVNLNQPSLVIPFNEKLTKSFVDHLPFKLTNGQRKVIWQIYLDLQKPQPMNRLVEGDVGSGKTVIAAMAALLVLKSDYQVAFMAPTELLARQHADTIYQLLRPLGMEQQMSLLVGGLAAKQKLVVHSLIAKGKIKLIVGTQALIQDKVDMKRLALVIIDEQHRFGVEQRKTLMSKAGHMPHVLSLTATPIPRSLALTLYGELDISILTDMPDGRKPVITKIISPNSMTSINQKLLVALKSGRQMFVVCPNITESESMTVKSVEESFKQLRQSIYKSFRIGMIHGRLKTAEKNKIMQQFVEHKLDILVSTTVIEVGVDIPNASIMLIENPERFGLAQIHQLRGRVGRGVNQGYCYLLMNDSSAPNQRLRALEASQDGFKLAELDLSLRGPGAIYGTFQHGQLDLKVAQLNDSKLIMAARTTAQKFIDKKEDLLQYKQLSDKLNRLRAVTNLN